MEIVAAIATAKSLLDLGKEIGAIVKKADGTEEATKRVSLYLESAECAVGALGLERQRILTQLRKLDMSNPKQVSAAWARLDKYLLEDNIRPILERSIRGLNGCHSAIENQARGLRWRKRDKEAAVADFTATLYELERTLGDLTCNFYPGMSGMGVQTLKPIYTLLGEARKRNKPHQVDPAALESLDEELAGLLRKALHDPSHDEWFVPPEKSESWFPSCNWPFARARTQSRIACVVLGVALTGHSRDGRKRASPEEPALQVVDKCRPKNTPHCCSVAHRSPGSGSSKCVLRSSRSRRRLERPCKRGSSAQG